MEKCTTPLILIVDDEVDIVETLKMALEFNNFRVLCAADGEEALRLVRERQPDLILLDRVLPKKNGLEVCRELKNDRQTQKIPIIMLSARVQEQDKLQGLECGAADYLIKPFEMDELLKNIQDRLQRGRTL